MMEGTNNELTPRHARRAAMTTRNTWELRPVTRGRAEIRRADIRQRSRIDASVTLELKSI